MGRANRDGISRGGPDEVTRPTATICPGARRGAASAAALALRVAVVVGDSGEPEPAAIASRQAAQTFSRSSLQGAPQAGHVPLSGIVERDISLPRRQTNVPENTVGRPLGRGWERLRVVTVAILRCRDDERGAEGQAGERVPPVSVADGRAPLRPNGRVRKGRIRRGVPHRSRHARDVISRPQRRHAGGEGHRQHHECGPTER